MKYLQRSFSMATTLTPEGKKNWDLIDWSDDDKEKEEKE